MTAEDVPDTVENLQFVVNRRNERGCIHRSPRTGPSFGTVYRGNEFSEKGKCALSNATPFLAEAPPGLLNIIWISCMSGESESVPERSRFAESFPARKLHPPQLLSDHVHGGLVHVGITLQQMRN